MYGQLKLDRNLHIYTNTLMVKAFHDYKLDIVSTLRLIAFIVITFLLTAQSQAYSKDFFKSFASDVYSVIVDPIGLKTGSTNINQSAEKIDSIMQRSLLHIEKIQGEADNDIRHYIESIEYLTSSTIDDIEDVWGQVNNDIETRLKQIDLIITGAASTFLELERQFYDETKHLILCATKTSLLSAREELSNALNDLGARKPTITIFGYEFLAVSISPNDIPSPIQGLRELVSASSALFLDDEYLSEHTSRWRVTDIYGEIKRLSRSTRCHYEPNDSAYQDAYMIELEFDYKDRLWQIF